MNAMQVATINASIIAVTTLTEANALVADLDQKIQDVEYTLLTEERRIERMTTSALGIDSDLASAQAEKTSYEAVIPTLPAGNPVRVQLEDKVVALNFRIFQLENRKERIGRSAIVQAQLKYCNLLSSVADLNEVKVLAVQRVAALTI